MGILKELLLLYPLGGPEFFVEMLANPDPLILIRSFCQSAASSRVIQLFALYQWRADNAKRRKTAIMSVCSKHCVDYRCLR